MFSVSPVGHGDSVVSLVERQNRFYGLKPADLQSVGSWILHRVSDSERRQAELSSDPWNCFWMKTVTQWVRMMFETHFSQINNKLGENLMKKNLKRIMLKFCWGVWISTQLSAPLSFNRHGWFKVSEGRKVGLELDRFRMRPQIYFLTSRSFKSQEGPSTGPDRAEEQEVL